MDITKRHIIEIFQIFNHQIIETLDRAVPWHDSTNVVKFIESSNLQIFNL